MSACSVSIVARVTRAPAARRHALQLLNLKLQSPCANVQSAMFPWLSNL